MAWNLPIDEARLRLDPIRYEDIRTKRSMKDGIVHTEYYNRKTGLPLPMRNS